MPVGLDYAVFDFAVNSGVSRAVRYLQKLVGVEQDGALGFISMAAIEKAYAKNEEQMIIQYCANRLAFVRSLGTFATFGKGWTRRIIGYQAGVQEKDSGVVDYAVMMARRDVAITIPVPTMVEPNAKAIAPLKTNTFVVAPEINSIGELMKLSQQNDALNKIITG